MSDPLDHATGLEKYELLAKQAGNDVSIKFDNLRWESRCNMGNLVKVLSKGLRNKYMSH